MMMVCVWFFIGFSGYVAYSVLYGMALSFVSNRYRYCVSNGTFCCCHPICIEQVFAKVILVNEFFTHVSKEL